MEKVGVVIVGINGAVASTTIAGVELMVRGLVSRIGMVTESTEAEIGETLPDLLEFVPLENLVFGGWDVRFDNVYEGAAHHRAMPGELLSQVKDKLSSMKPWPAVFTRAYAENVAGTNVVRAKTY